MKRASVISLIVIGLISISLIGYYQLSIMSNGSPDWVEPMPGYPDCGMRSESSSCDDNPNTRMLWDRRPYSESCTSLVRWVFNQVQSDIYKIKLLIMNEIGYATLKKIEIEITSGYYVEVWSGSESLTPDGEFDFIFDMPSSVLSGVLTFDIPGGTFPGIAEIYFMQYTEPPDINITYTMTVLTFPNNCEVFVSGIGTLNSGDVGVAVFEDVAYGSYDIIVSKSGYPSVTKTVFIDSDAVINIDITQTLLLVWFLLILIIVVAVGVIIYCIKKGIIRF